MTKRRINKQQTRRIHSIQTAFQNTEDSACQGGLVITRFGKRAEVETDGLIVQCSIRPNIDSLVAGDKVKWMLSGDKGVIVSRDPRRSVLNRFNYEGEGRAVAANITQMVIVIAVKPDPSWMLLDSYLVMVELLNLKPVIICNKIDLPAKRLEADLKKCYEPLGYPLLFTSKVNGQLKKLQEALSGEVSVFVGQSGVGKSSLISACLPHEHSIAIAEISSKSELGCHTTRNSRYFHLPQLGALIDSPGVREFKLSPLPRADLIRGFPEFRDLVFECKYRNCNHSTDAGCALVEAVKEKKVSFSRHESLIQLIKQFAVIG